MLAEGDFQATILRGYLGFKYTGENAACLELGIRDAAGNPFKETWTGGFDGKWLAVTMKSLRRCGLEGNDLRAVAGLKGRRINITVQHKKAKKSDRVYLNIFINAGRPMDESEAAAFADSMVNAIAAIGKPDDEPEQDEAHETAPDNAPQGEREPGSDLDDDIPT